MRVLTGRPVAELSKTGMVNYIRLSRCRGWWFRPDLLLRNTLQEEDIRKGLSNGVFIRISIYYKFPGITQSLWFRGVLVFYCCHNKFSSLQQHKFIIISQFCKWEIWLLTWLFCLGYRKTGILSVWLWWISTFRVIEVFGRTHFHVSVGSNACFLAGCWLGVILRV